MALEMMSNKRTTNERRGVAPIIATLLMVAIAVVGGILIFVFAQGFFNTTSVAGPTIESVTLFGYDAREIEDNTGLDNYAGIELVGVGHNGTSANNQLTAGEEVAFYFRNTGSQDLIIASIEVAGNTLTFSSTDLGAVDAEPAAGEYIIMTDAESITDVADIANIPAGTDVTLVASMEDTAPLKVGRNYPVEITTGNGATFKFDFIAGTTRGGS